MKTSNGRRCSCSVPSFSTMSLIVTYMRMIGHRRLDLVRRPDQDLRALELLVHADDFGLAAGFVPHGSARAASPRGFVIRLRHFVS